MWFRRIVNIPDLELQDSNHSPRVGVRLLEVVVSHLGFRILARSPREVVRF
jgi:hypothetical protein